VIYTDSLDYARIVKAHCDKPIKCACGSIGVSIQQQRTLQLKAIREEWSWNQFMEELDKTMQSGKC
jgi:hypothetical protein